MQLSAGSRNNGFRQEIAPGVKRKTMRTTFYKFGLSLTILLLAPVCASADEKVATSPSAKISADDQEKVDAVIREATSPVKASDLEKPITAPTEKVSPGEKAVVTLSGSDKPLLLPELKKEPGKAEVKLTPPKKAAVVAKSVEPKLPTSVKSDLKKSAAKKPVKSVAAVKTAPKAVQKSVKKPAASVSVKAVPKKREVVAKKPEQVKPKFEGTTKPLSSYELGRYQYCGDDRDCMPAVNGCCDCANGGEDVAVNRERFESFRARFSCLSVGCGEKNGQKCGTGLVSCVNHKCRYFSDRTLDQKF